MQISLLKSQINPHFLFNTLTHQHAHEFQQGAGAQNDYPVGRCFRYALDSYKTETVELSKEIHFIENYIRIQQVRFWWKIALHKSIDSAFEHAHTAHDFATAGLRNSVKYGIAPKEDGGNIHLTVKSEGDKVFLKFVMTD